MALPQGVGEIDVLRALGEIVAACPPAASVAADCAGCLAHCLQQQQQQQQQQAAAGRGSRDNTAQAMAAIVLTVLLRHGSASSQEAAARAAVDAGAVEVLLLLGRMPGDAGWAAALNALGGLVATAEPSLRMPEAVMAAGGVEAALAQLLGPTQAEEEEQEEEEEADAEYAAVGLLYNLLEHSKLTAEECRRWLLAAGGMAPIVQHLVRWMAAEVSGWPKAAAQFVAFLVVSSGEGGVSDSSLCSPAMAVEAVEAGVVPVLLGCLALSSSDPDYEMVQEEAVSALGALVAALFLSDPSGRRQLPEPLMMSALRPAAPALVGLLRSTQLPNVADAVLRALCCIARVDKALCLEVAAAGAAQLATQWSRRPGVAAQMVQAANSLLGTLAFQGDTVPGRDHALTFVSPGQQGSGSGDEATRCAACGAASRPGGKALMVCSACRGVSYCSGACQKRDWGKHKGAFRRAEG
jgi:hypothetical protein